MGVTADLEAIRENLLLTRFAVDRSAFALFWCDGEGRLIHANSVACRLLGYTGEELRELSIADLAGIAPEEWPEFWGLLRGSATVEIDARRKDGARVPVQISVQWMEHGGREYGCISAFAIHERRQTEAALREQERLFRELAENIREVFYVADMTRRRVLYASPAYEEIWGRPREALYRDFAEFTGPMLPEDRSAFEAMLALRSPGTPYAFEYRIRRPDGSIRWLHARTYPVPEERGFDKVVGVAEDVTERKLAEEALRASEQRYRRLLEESPDTVLLHDGAKIVYINAAGVRLLGARSTEELVGRPPLELVHPDSRSVVAERIRQAIAGRPANPTVEIRMLRLDGTAVDVESTGVPYTAADGAAQVVLRDVTERKRLEQQFREAQKMEAVGRLAGGVAHDFNNLLTVITGYGSVLAEELRPGDPLLPAVEEIRKAAERAAGLTRQLLAFSRRQVLQPKVVDLNALIGDMESMLRRLLGEDIRLETRLAGDLGCIKADPGQIEQVVMNLAVNARDAMPRGGTLTLETREVAAPPDLPAGRCITLAVADTGTGMSKDILARLFEPFFTTKEKGKGTGLGLSTSYGIVKQSGGHIAVESEPGRGSRFTVFLPRVDAPAEQEAVRLSPAKLEGRESVLLVEDDAVVRRLAAHVLRGGGYRVHEAEDAEAAIRLAGTPGQAVDLLVSDVVMPGIDGPRLAEALRAAQPRLKVLLVSGYTEDALVQAGGLPEGMSLLTKPFQPKQLLQKVRDVLDAES